MHMQVRLLSGLKKLFCEHMDACCAACMGYIGTRGGGVQGFRLKSSQPVQGSALSRLASMLIPEADVCTCMSLLKRDDSIRKDRELRS